MFLKRGFCLKRHRCGEQLINLSFLSKKRVKYLQLYVGCVQQPSSSSTSLNGNSSLAKKKGIL